MIPAGLSVFVSAFVIGGLTNDSHCDAFVEWAAHNAVPIRTVEPGEPFDDLQPLRKVVGNARVVCLGESRHDAREHFRFKHRMIEFLVEEMGFTHFAMEESLPCAGLINEYVLSGRGDPEALLNSMGAWFIWDTQEVLALIKWMRSYNEDPNHRKKVKFYGIDITDPLLGVKSTLTYLERLDPGYTATFRSKPDPIALLSENIWSETLENYRRLSPGELDTLSARYADMLTRVKERHSEYMAASSGAVDDWMLRQAIVAAEANKLFTAGVRGTFVDAGHVREKAMADNIRWILKRAGKGEGLIVWAHNFHVTRSPADLDIPRRPPAQAMMSMTTYLSGQLGEDLVSFGFSFNRGDYPGGPLPPAGRETVDGVLARVGLPRFVVDLRKAPKEWVGRKLRMRGQGGHADLIPLDAFDALFFVESITKTVPTSKARKRFGTLRR
ncbi:MAG: erythromycin esterase family protein [Planctomycetota bacterium]|jgi:erythromycin esterase